MSDAIPAAGGGPGRPAEAASGIHQILGDFVLHERVGEGSSAVVYRALNRTFHGIVAVKVWRAPLTGSQRDKFLDECKLQWKLSEHPNIVRLYWADAPMDAPPWLATELYETSLAQRVFTDPPLSHAEILNIADDILSGLAAVHAERILHRDVKPANVLLKGGTAALGDLGITMHLDGWTRDGAAGTDAFLAPELIRGAPPNFRSDVFSAAVTVRYMFGENIPPEIERVLTRAASHDPHDRPVDATALREQLSQARSAVQQSQADQAGLSTIGPTTVATGARGVPLAADGSDRPGAVLGTDPSVVPAGPPVSTGPAADGGPASHARVTSTSPIPPRSGSSRHRVLSVTLMTFVWAVVLVVAAVVGYGASRSTRSTPIDSRPSTSTVPRPAGSASGSRPATGSASGSAFPISSASGAASPAAAALEACTADIQQNPQWVCLTAATLSSSQLVLRYTGNFAPSPSLSSHHIHIFTTHLDGNGALDPPDSVMGMQAPDADQGYWWTSYNSATFTLPLSMPSDSPRDHLLDRNDTFVCVRVATQVHGLVNDLHGGYKTGNCWPMT